MTYKAQIELAKILVETLDLKKLNVLDLLDAMATSGLMLHPAAPDPDDSSVTVTSRAYLECLYRGAG